MRKIYTFNLMTALMLFWGWSLQGQNPAQIAHTWCPAGTYPAMPQATYYHAAAWLGDTLYVQAPSSTGVYAKTIYKYTYGGSWQTGDSCLYAVTGAAMTSCNGKLYLLGGGTTSISTGTGYVQEYDPLTGIWTEKSAMPAVLSGHGAVCWGDSVIFVIGGPWGSSATATNVYYYRPATDTWGTITASLPAGTGRRSFAIGICDDSKIVISCGYNSGYLKSTYVGTIGSDASQISWAAGADAPVALSRTGGTGIDDFFFVVGGDTNGTSVKNDKVFMYNVPGNQWFSQIPSHPNPASNHFSAITSRRINDTIRIFQPGGYGAFSAAMASLDITGCGQGLPVLLIDSVFGADVSCPGANDGEVIIYASGGTGNLDYSLIGGISWSPDSNFSSLPPNSWTVAVKDSLGLVKFWDNNPVIISEPPPAVFTLNDTACLSYGINDSTYTVSGTYVQHLTSTGGCDSTLTLNLVIDTLVFAGFDSTLSVCNNLVPVIDLFDYLTGNYDAGGTWLDDDATGELSGSIFSIGNVVPGNFYDFTYQVSGGACPADEARISLFAELCLGLDDAASVKPLVYPNPVSDVLVIARAASCRLQITDITGRILLQQNISDNHHQINLEHIATGYYLVSITGEDVSLVRKIDKR